MNLGQLANRVMDATLRGGSLTGGNRDQIKEDINEAIKEVDALLRPTTKKVTKTLIASQLDYSLVTDWLLTDVTSIRDIVYASTSNPGVPRTLMATSPEELRALRNQFVYSDWVGRWAFEGWDTVLLYPTTQQSGDTIDIYYTARPADLLNETDVPIGLPPEFHDVYELAAIKRSMRQTSPEYAQQYYAMFQKRLDDYRKFRSHRDGALARRVTVGRAGARQRPRDPSTDLGY